MNWVANFACRFSRHTLCLAVHVLALPRVRWRNCFPIKKPRIYYFNHSSHADTVIIWACLPPAVRATVRPLAAQDYWLKSRLRRFMAGRVLRAIFVDRQPGDAEERQDQLLRILDSMGPDTSLLMAPEGTRGTGERIQSFKSGLYYLCQQNPQLELVPVLLQDAHRLLPRGSFLPRPVACGVHFGPPMHLLPGEGKDEFLDRARRALLDLSR